MNHIFIDLRDEEVPNKSTLLRPIVVAKGNNLFVSQTDNGSS